VLFIHYRLENLILGKPSGEGQNPSKNGWKLEQNPGNEMELRKF